MEEKSNAAAISTALLDNVVYKVYVTDAWISK